MNQGRTAAGSVNRQGVETMRQNQRKPADAAARRQAAIARAARREEAQRRQMQQTAHRAQAKRRPPARQKRARRRLSRAGRRLAALLVCAALLLAGGAAAWWLLPVQSVTVEGKTPYTAAAVTQAAGIQTGARLFGVNRRAVAARLTAALPYVGQAAVVWNPPLGLTLHLTAAAAAAAVQRTDGYALVSADGKLLEVVKDLSAHTGLPVLTGPDYSKAKAGETPSAAAKKVTQALALAKKAKAAGISGVTAVDVSDRYELRFTVQSRVTVTLGTSASLADKLRFAAYMLKKELGASETGTLDVSQVPSSSRAYFTPAG